jgi:hypothetical protein
LPVTVSFWSPVLIVSESNRAQLTVVVPLPVQPQLEFGAQDGNSLTLIASVSSWRRKRPVAPGLTVITFWSPLEAVNVHTSTIVPMRKNDKVLDCAAAGASRTQASASASASAPRRRAKLAATAESPPGALRPFATARVVGCGSTTGPLRDRNLPARGAQGSRQAKGPGTAG